MSKQLATIHTDVPLPLKIEDLAFNGKNVEHLVQFYKEMDFNSFLAKLDTSEYGALEEPLPDVTYELVTEVTDEMLTDDMVMYMEMLEENYHVAPIEGIAFSNGKKTYVMIGEEVFENTKLRKMVSK